MKCAIFTIVTRNRLHLARVLMGSAATAFPAAERHVLVLDDATGFFDPAAEPFKVTFARDLALPRFEEYAFVNDALSLCCMLKPAFALHLLQQTTADVVIYADSDTFFYHQPDALLDLLRNAPVVLTPHVIAPLAEQACRTDGDIMRTGAFNAGFFAVRRSTEASSFLTWWLGAMCRERKLEVSYTHDQQFLSLASVYFPWIGVLRDPGYNVAYWNISERPIARTTNTGLTAAGRPLVLFHYSYFDPSAPELLAHRPPIVVPATNETMVSLQRAYAESIARAGAATCRSWSYGYDFFTDGTTVTLAQKDFYLKRVWGEPDRNGSPFDPAFSTSHYQGLRSVYAFSKPLPRLIRQVRRWVR